MLDVETGKQLDDPLKWVRFARHRLEQGRQRFLLQPLPGAAAGRRASGGRAQPDDLLPQAGHEAGGRRAGLPPAGSSRLELLGRRRSDDGKYLVLSIARSTDPQNQVLCAMRRAAADAPFKELIGDFENEFWFIGNEGTRFYFLTDLDAPTKRIVAMDIDQPGREHVTEIVPAARGDARRRQHPQRPDHRPVHGRRAEPRSRCSTSPASRSATVELPGKGTVDGFGGDQDDKETFFVFTSYNMPPSVYRYDVLGEQDGADPPAEGEVRSRRVRGRASVLQQQGRHARADDARLSQGSCERTSRIRRCSTATAATASR